MNITKARMKDFENMMIGIAKRHGCHIRLEHEGTSDTEVLIRNGFFREAKYFVKWDEAVSLTDAAVDIWANWFDDSNSKRDYTAYVKKDIEVTREIAHVQSHSIKNVIFNDPATIVFWHDGTKTVVKCSEDDIFDPEKGLAMAISKKFLGNQGNYYNEIRKWVGKEDEKKLKYLNEQFEEIRKKITEICEHGISIPTLEINWEAKK